MGPQGHYGAWAEKWVKESVVNARERRVAGGREVVWRTDDAVRRDWQSRWEASRAGKMRDGGPAADVWSNAITKGGNLRLYGDMAKAHASALCQARTGKIGLRKFLFSVKVPSVSTRICQCGEEE